MKCALLCLRSLADALGVSITPSSTVSRPAGSTLLLTCTLSPNAAEAKATLSFGAGGGADSLTVGWYKQVDGRRKIEANSALPVYTEMDAPAWKHKLIFSSLRDSDTGAYVCAAQLNGRNFESSVTVTVTRKSRFRCDLRIVKLLENCADWELNFCSPSVPFLFSQL